MTRYTGIVKKSFCFYNSTELGLDDVVLSRPPSLSQLVSLQIVEDSVINEFYHVVSRSAHPAQFF